MNKPDTYICDHCEYDLTGLPGEGNCPECGRAYSTRSLIGVKVPLPGYAKGERLARRARTIGLVVVAFGVLFICGGGLALVSPRSDRAWSIGAFLALIFLLMAVISYISEKE